MQSGKLLGFRVSDHRLESQETEALNTQHLGPRHSHNCWFQRVNSDIPLCTGGVCVCVPMYVCVCARVSVYMVCVHVHYVCVCV